MKHLKIVALAVTLSLGASPTQACEPSETTLIGKIGSCIKNHPIASAFLGIGVVGLGLALLTTYHSGASAPTINLQKSQQNTQILFPGVVKLNNDLYVGKVNDNLHLAMERVDKNNIEAWSKYADYQEQANRLNGCRPDGSLIFQQVLSNYKNGRIKNRLNELWIAYVSQKPITAKARFLFEEGNSPQPSFAMFCTVITSPRALITTHMGISKTVEVSLRERLERKNHQLSPQNKHSYLSLDLHSFAAKVMKLQNPQKKYMLTAPTEIMRTILLKNMPKDSVFVGDNLYQKSLTEANKKQSEYWSSDISGLKTNPPRIIIKEKPRYIFWTKKEFTIQNPDETMLATFEKTTSDYQWFFIILHSGFIGGLGFPYVLVDLDALAKVKSLEK